jgi:hypothetical protein
MVGYINQPMVVGFQMIANQLDNGTGNRVGDLLQPTSPAPLSKYVTGTGFATIDYDPDALTWTDPNFTLNPGEGAFLSPDAAYTQIFVGEVPTGSLSTPLVNGFQIVSSKVPQQGTLTALGFPGSTAPETVFVYRKNPPKGYDSYDWDPDALAWSPGDPAGPTIEVGQAFFLQGATSRSWTRSFPVGP